ncbi:MAG: calcium-binding protein, partial [Nitrospirota bacterium]
AQTVRGDLSAVRAEIQSQLDADYNHGRQLLTEFSRTVQGFQAADMLNFTAFGNAFVTRNEELAWAIDSAGKKIATGTAGSDTISGGSRAEAFAGGEGNDTLRGSEGDDALYGGNGDDTLDGGIGADVLHGGKGNDLLNGGVNNDTYRFWLGGGVDTINDYDNTVGNSDTVEFGEGIMSADVELLKEGSDLRINIRGTTDSLIIQSWFSGNSYKIEQFKFADGTVLTVTDLNAIGYKVYGTALNDIPLQGSNGRDEMYGYDGNDTLRGNEGDDVLYGGNGDDTLDGGYGNDVLDGGAGNDSLQSGYGNDTYRFALGSGTDTISDYDTTVGNADTVEFRQGITRSDLEMIKEGNDLRIAVKGSMDTLILQNWFLGPAYRVEEFRFADGTVVSAGDLGISIPFVIRGTAGNDNMSGTIWRDELYGKEGNDVLWALSGDDVLDGGAGNDLLYGDKGNDTYRFGLGGGVDTINDYDNTMGNSDTVEFGEGVSSADVEFAKEGMDLRITIKGTADALKVANWFSNDGRSYYIERFVFHDGTAISAGDLGTSIPFMIRGTTTADTLVGTNLRDELYGGEGNDTLKGGGGADVLDGGIGNDSLLGGAGNDIYRFNLGYGMDTISEYDTAAGNIDTVEFGSGIVQSDLELFKEGDSLRINIKGTTDSLVIQYWFVSDGYKVEQFKFADGSVLTPAGLDAIGYKVYGTAGNDTSLQGSNANDEMLGYAGNDYIYGNQGNDVLDGGAGVDYLNGGQGNDILNGGADNDTLYGESGSDILDGGTGNDYLSGSLGNDTYKFALGSGIDTIYDYDTTVGNTDTVAISANPLDLIFARNGSNLDITINSTTDRITVQNWYSTTGYQTEVFHTADGDNLLNTQVDQLIQAMATFCTNNGISSWSQAIQDRPQDVQQVLAQYWTPQMP